MATPIFFLKEKKNEKVSILCDEEGVWRQQTQESQWGCLQGFNPLRRGGGMATLIKFALLFASLLILAQFSSLT